MWKESLHGIDLTSLLESDKGNPKLPRHFKPSLKDDEFETPEQLFLDLCKKYQVNHQLDVAATEKNKKCDNYFTFMDNALEKDWVISGDHLVDIWCNHPHTLHEQFVVKAHQQWKKHNITIMMIIPANCCRTNYWHKYIEDQAEYHAIKGSIRFLQNGRPTKDTSRNAYMVVIWKKK